MAPARRACLGLLLLACAAVCAGEVLQGSARPASAAWRPGQRPPPLAVAPPPGPAPAPARKGHPLPPPAGWAAAACGHTARQARLAHSHRRLLDDAAVQPAGAAVAPPPAPAMAGSTIILDEVVDQSERGEEGTWDWYSGGAALRAPLASSTTASCTPALPPGPRSSPPLPLPPPHPLACRVLHDAPRPGGGRGAAAGGGQPAGRRDRLLPLLPG